MNATSMYDVTSDDNVIPQVGAGAAWCWPCVSRHSAARASSVLWTYVPPVLVVFGITGNLLTLAVLRSRHHKASPINVALAALALADIGVLLLPTVNHWMRTVWGVDLRHYGNIPCKLHLSLSHMFGSLSPMLLALTTLERCLSVCLPLKVAGLVTKRRITVICGLLTAFICLCHLPLFVYARIRPEKPLHNRCSWSSPTFTAVWFWLSFILQYLLPFTVIVIGNSVIIATLGVQRRRRQRALGTHAQEAAHHAGGSISVTVMLVTVGVAFLVTMTPYNIYMLGTSHGLWKTPDEPSYARFLLFVSLCYQLTYVNSAVNFVLYCVGGSKFRKSLKAMFRDLCGKKRTSGDDFDSIKTISTSIN